MSAIDTPDYQRGVVSAQTLLARTPNTVLNVTVGIPYNAETIVIIAPEDSIESVVNVIGIQSSVTYPVVRAAPGPDGTFFYVDISAAVDQQVFIELFETSGVGTTDWYVYADTAAHVIVDSTTSSDINGAQYVIPTAPSLHTGDHPPVEVLVIDAGFTATGPLLAAPGVNQRYRILDCTINPLVAGSIGVLVEAGSGFPIFTGSLGGASYMHFGPSGNPRSTNVGLGCELIGGTEFAVCLAYTQETV